MRRAPVRVLPVAACQHLAQRWRRIIVEQQALGVLRIADAVDQRIPIQAVGPSIRVAGGATLLSLMTAGPLPDNEHGGRGGHPYKCIIIIIPIIVKIPIPVTI